MIVHLFNSSIVSGPEILVMPALKGLRDSVHVVLLEETRLGKSISSYVKGLGLPYSTVIVKKRWDTQAFADLGRLLAKLDPSLVHAHDVKASTYLVQAIKSLSSAGVSFAPQTVSTHHGASSRAGKLRLYEEYYVRKVLPHFDAILTVCEADRLSLLKRGLPESKVHLHLNGVNRSMVSRAMRPHKSAEIRKKWNLKSPILIGVVGRMSPEKRFDRILDVFSHLRVDGTRLVCFGSGPEESKLRRLSKVLGVDHKVDWMGYSDSISDEMAGFDLLISLSSGEGIPISMLEAGWAGTPVFATKVGGISDLIDSVETGMLVLTGDSNFQISCQLASLLKHPEHMRLMGEKFQRRVMDHFTQDHWISNLQSIYSKLLRLPINSSRPLASASLG